VVTGIEIELFDVPTLYGGSLYFDLAEHPAVPGVWREWTETVPEEVTSAIAILPMPDIPQVPEPLRGKYIAQVQLAILGDDGADLIKPLRAIGEPVMDTVGELPYVDSGRIFAEPDRPDSYSSSNLLLSDLDQLATLPKPGEGPLCVIGIRHLGGALTRRPEVPNAVGHRDAAYALTVLTPGSRDTRRLRQQILEPWRRSAVGRLLNFSFEKLTADELAEAYDPGDHARLTALRRRYDPAARLWVNHQL
jgi:hypothetical protein